MPVTGVGIGVSSKFSKLLERKADRSELDEKLKEKASKADAEMALRQIEIMHKQLK